MLPVTRVPWNDMVTLKRVLDAGAATLLVPFVQNADEARRAVELAALDAAAIAALVDAKTHCDGADPEFIHSSPTFARLDAATTLLTVDLNCGGAYNVATGVFLLDNGGASRPAVFDSPTDYAEFGANWISSGYWDDAERELSSYHRGRGLGDCGDSASYAWDGDQFRLTEQAEMPVCRGSMETIRTFRRPVERL